MFFKKINDLRNFMHIFSRNIEAYFDIQIITSQLDIFQDYGGIA